MAKMTPQDAAMLKILQRKYGKSVYPDPGATKAAPKSPAKTTGTLRKIVAKSPDQAMAQNKSMLAAKNKKK